MSQSIMCCNNLKSKWISFSYTKNVLSLMVLITIIVGCCCDISKGICMLYKAVKAVIDKGFMCFPTIDKSGYLRKVPCIVIFIRDFLVNVVLAVFVLDSEIHHGAAQALCGFLCAGGGRAGSRKSRSSPNGRGRSAPASASFPTGGSTPWAPTSPISASPRASATHWPWVRHWRPNAACYRWWARSLDPARNAICGWRSPTWASMRSRRCPNGCARCHSVHGAPMWRPYRVIAHCRVI